jgi:RHS repeat-associated protein
MENTWSKFFYILFGLVVTCGSPCSAQVVTGTPLFNSFGGGPDIVNLYNLNVHIPIPVVSKAGRATPFAYNYGYDSSIWYPVGTSGSQAWMPVNRWGWMNLTQPATGYITYTATRGDCRTASGGESLSETTYTNWAYLSADGTSHPFLGSTRVLTGPCTVETSSLTVTAYDGSGYTLNAKGGSGTVTSPDGSIVTGTFTGVLGPATLTDRNGNEITGTAAGVFTDTTGNTALTVTYAAPPSPTTIAYTAPNGEAASFTINYGTYTVRTNFGCSGITEFGPTTEYLVNSITLPDSTLTYSFTYEPTPGYTGDVTGRLKSVTLPTGGSITYAYTGSNNGIECLDGSAAGLTRTPNPGGEWTYTRVLGSVPWTTSTTTVTDPLSNQTVVNFQYVRSLGGYETERQVYQGSTGGTLLETISTCYNGSAPNCNATSISPPLTERSVYLQWPGTAGQESRTDTSYNSYGLTTEVDEYAYGPGAPGSLARKTLTTYASLGNGIVDRPASVTVEDGSGNVKAQTSYCYDEATPSGTTTCGATGAPAATSGTPQHVAISGSRGNLTTVASLVQGSTTLGKKFTYYDTGNISTATDVNNAVTTYTYGSGISCGNSFATSISEPMGLSRSMAWNCVGGVQTSLTDENGQPTTTTYSDAHFWRTNQVKDAASNVANLTYDAAISVEGSVVFGSSATDALTTLDGLGRKHISQIKESPTSSTYDSVETDYDGLGRPSRITLPYAATAGGTNGSVPGTSTAYDALGRKTQVTDSAGLTVVYTYSQNDVYITVGPAPTGENAKRKQLEYDALGRLTSVCEVTSATGSGSCGQTNAATGYLTQYTYDVLNNLISVTQNAQSASKQTRTFTYDDLRRLTSETNPESGTKNYYYDSDSTMCGNGAMTFLGDLVKTIDAAGNCVVMFHDVLHRLTDLGNSNQSVSHCKRFRYDNSPGYPGSTKPSGLANTLGRLVEAATDQCVTGNDAIITDEWFGYTVLGQRSDVYESTPHSGGYYHTSASYWPSGVPSGITGVVYSVNYNVDGEGRIFSTSNVAGQNPLASTYYNTASQPTQVNFGSSDSDTFTYDPNSNRMTQYKFNVNGQAVTGTLTWNAIGTLKTLAVTDQFYGPDNQTCSYTHDDMSRVASANCGSPWNQSFTYDAFGNISKSGTISFQPTYSYLTNRMTQIGSSTPTYDSNGNVLNDTAHTYTWDEYGKPMSIDGVTLTYDALGRMVEQNRNGSYTEIDYAPTGAKLQILQGPNAVTDFTPLPGGAVAVDLASVGGLAYYRHSDWLGSSRLASTPSRTIYYDGAYAPFGESYAQTGTTDLSFTGMNQDTVSNLFDFPAREYNAIHGRWPSPDPARLAAVDTSDPQTFNRYAYVRNGPLAATDPSGLCTGNLGCRDPRNQEPSSPWYGDPFAYIDVPVVAVGPGWTPPGGGGTFDFPGGWGEITLVGGGWATTSTIVGDASMIFGGDQPESNPYVALGADALGIVGTATGHPVLGYAGSAMSVMNDHSSLNLLMTGFSFVPVLGEGVAALGVVQDVGLLAGQAFTDHVTAPMFNAAPPQMIDNGNGQLIPNPALMDEGDLWNH